MPHLNKVNLSGIKARILTLRQKYPLFRVDSFDSTSTGIVLYCKYDMFAAAAGILSMLHKGGDRIYGSNCIDDNAFI